MNELALPRVERDVASLRQKGSQGKRRLCDVLDSHELGAAHAVGHPNPPSSSSGSATIAEVREGPHALPDGSRALGPRVDGIEPHRGWTLHTWDGLTGDGSVRPAFVAHGPADHAVLQASRFAFTPTQARFAWLVDNTVLGRRVRSGPWTDATIDAAIAAESTLEAVRVVRGRGSPEHRRAALALAGCAA